MQFMAVACHAHNSSCRDSTQPSLARQALPRIRDLHLHTKASDWCWYRWKRSHPNLNPVGWRRNHPTLNPAGWRRSHPNLNPVGFKRSLPNLNPVRSGVCAHPNNRSAPTSLSTAQPLGTSPESVSSLNSRERGRESCDESKSIQLWCSLDIFKAQEVLAQGRMPMWERGPDK